MEKEPTHIIVLGDGETWGSLNGCRIVELPPDLQIEDVEELLKRDEMVTVTQFS